MRTPRGNSLLWPLLPGCVALCALVVSCTTDQFTREGVSTQVDERVIFLVRHGEKCLGQGDDPALTPEGTARSIDLMRTLKEIPLDAVYTTPFRRTVATATPVAEDHGLTPIRTPIAPAFLDELAARIMAGTEHYVLVSGHSDTTPTLVNKLAGTELDNLADDVYDRLFVVTLRSGEEPSVLNLGYGPPSAALTECPAG